MVSWRDCRPSVRKYKDACNDILLKSKPKIAVGTNLSSASVMGATGLIGHILNNNVGYHILMLMGPGAMLGAYLGARYTNRFGESI